jgi:phosphate/sulfate permease
LIIITLLLAATSFVYTANNIGVIRTAFSGSTGRGLWLYLCLSLVGFTAGFALEGHKIGSSITNGLTHLDPTASLVSLSVTLLILSIFTFLKLPVSISNVAVGAIIGSAFAFGLPISTWNLVRVLASWLVAPLTSAILVLAIYFSYCRGVSGLPLGPASRLNRLLGMLAIGFSSYSLSANNLGILMGFSEGTTDAVITLFFALLGSITLSGLVAWTLGYRIASLSPTAYASALLAGSLTLWIYTQLGIPASMAQTVISAMMVLSILKKPSIVNRRVMFEILGSWPFFLVFATILSFSIGILLI